MIGSSIPRYYLVALAAVSCTATACEKKPSVDKAIEQPPEKPIELPGDRPQPPPPDLALVATAVQLAEPDTAAAPQGERARVLDPSALAEHVENRFGYAILLPKGARELSKDDNSHTFSAILADGDNEINVTLSRIEVSSLSDAVNTVTMFGANDVLEQRDMDGGGYFVVKSPQLDVEEVWAFRHGHKLPVAAKCTGPKSNIAILRIICGSLRLIQ